MKDTVAEIRRLVAVAGPLEPSRKFVLYWMTACRRTQWNFGLERAVAWAAELARPLLVVEVLGTGLRWDSDRHHRFVLEGMADNARQLTRRGVLYRPCIEQARGDADRLLVALSRHACVIVGDAFPATGEATVDAAAWRQIGVRAEQVDSNGLLPLRAAEKAFTAAQFFRRFLHRSLPEHWLQMPKPDPLARAKLPPLEGLPREVERLWPAVSKHWSDPPAVLGALPLDHSVRPAAIRGGATSARAVFQEFLRRRLPHYAVGRNHPDDDATSGLSPYLHFGHISAQEIFHEVVRQEGRSLEPLARPAVGPGEPAWGLGKNAGAFVDELVTWRELSFNTPAYVRDFDRYESLPDWAKKTLARHAGDPRPRVYPLAALEAAATYDPIWNAAQRQLVRQGRIHNYLRMLWGKRILEWSAAPQEALEAMIELNNKYALDGRDPNSTSGIFWVLGRYDRAWGPQRPIFGTVRFMSSESTRRKLRLKEYLKEFGEG